MRADEEAQVHILEMLTLFWLFFMSATFLIRIEVPDAPSVALDAGLEAAGEDAIIAALATPSTDGLDSALHDHLAASDLDEACLMLQDLLSVGYEANCWVAADRAPAGPHGDTGVPMSDTVTVHHLLVTDGTLWTLSLDVWRRGGVS
jgi:hypothetical protein